MNGLSKTLNSGSLRENRFLQILEYSFKDFSRSLIDIAYSLNHSKDMKDLFYDLVERV